MRSRSLKGTEDKRYEGELYSLVGFARPTDPAPTKVAYKPAEDSAFPPEMTISPNRSPEWTESLDGIYFGIHDLKKKDEKEGAKPPEGEAQPPAGPAGEAAKEPDEKTRPDPLALAGQAAPGAAAGRGKPGQELQLSVHIQRCGKEFLRLADETVRQVTAAPEHRYAVGQDAREYELVGSLDGRGTRIFTPSIPGPAPGSWR